MPKGQQRGNKEVKKPKKGQTIPVAHLQLAVTPESKGDSTERPKKK